MKNTTDYEVSTSKNAMNKFKTEVAKELGIDLKADNLTAKDAGRVGGQMTKRLIEKAEREM